MIHNKQKLLRKYSHVNLILSLNYFEMDFMISDNVIVGNLIVRADPTFGGGELNLTGKNAYRFLNNLNFIFVTIFSHVIYFTLLFL